MTRKRRPTGKFGAVIDAYPQPIRDRLLALHALVWSVAESSPEVGEIEETLKWGQPSFVTSHPRSGTTVRIDRVRGSDDVAVFTHCQTSLVAECRDDNGDLFDYDGTRAVIVRSSEPLPERELRGHIQSALTYHLRGR